MPRTIATLLAMTFVLCFGSETSQAGTVSDSYGTINGTINAAMSAPDVVDPSSSIAVEIFGNLTSGGLLTWALWVDTTWAYDGSHRAVTSGGTLLHGPISVYNAFSMKLPVGPLTAGEHVLTLIVQRRYGELPTVAVDLPITVGSSVEAVEVDVLPGACPNPFQPRSRGTLPVALLGSADLDVNTVDVSTVRLAGVAPVRWSIEDVSGQDSSGHETSDCPLGEADGQDDLVLHFDRQALAAAMGTVARDEVVTLTLEAQTVDGRQLEGMDSVLVR